MICNDWSCITGSGKPDYKPATSTDFHQKRQKSPKTFVPPNDDNFNPRRKETPKLGCFRHRCPTNNNSIKKKPIKKICSLSVFCFFLEKSFSNPKKGAIIKKAY